MSPPQIPRIITHAEDILSSYDLILCDVWGVIHDGAKAYKGAMRALKNFRAMGGTVVLVSNAPVPETRVAQMLDVRDVDRNSWDAIVSSGAIALDMIAEKKLRSVFTIGPKERDAAFFQKLSTHNVPIERAEAIVCTGLNDDQNESPEDYKDLLLKGVSTNIPFICANPDLVVDIAGQHFICAGSLAQFYETLGGEVLWAGKPYLEAYIRAQKRGEDIRGQKVPKKKILAIGDSIRTDLKGAQNAGIDALFVTSGIHRAEIMEGETISLTVIKKALDPYASTVIAITASLDW